MRNVVLWIGMSLDGFTSGENEQLDWLVPHATQPEAHEVFGVFENVPIQFCSAG